MATHLIRHFVCSLKFKSTLWLRKEVNIIFKSLFIPSLIQVAPEQNSTIKDILSSNFIMISRYLEMYLRYIVKKYEVSIHDQNLLFVNWTYYSTNTTLPNLVSRPVVRGVLTRALKLFKALSKKLLTGVTGD